ncbi:hypothetical protein [Roseivirga seohaensis]|uniref:hypothetical protein n=1 Tax=Roseivirga seohaensis TaxID=1914963 RepID=UPI003BAAAF5C
MEETKNQPGDPVRYGDSMEGINRFKKECPNQPNTYSMDIEALEAMLKRGRLHGATNVTIDMSQSADGKNKILYGLTKGRNRISATAPDGINSIARAENWEDNTFLNFTQECPPLPKKYCPCDPDDPNCDTEEGA